VSSVCGKSGRYTRADFLWEREGRPEGRALDHWLRASEEVPDEEDNVPGG
jgi:hypothetical protein